MPIYLDCNATAPLEPDVKDVILRYMLEEFGNAGSRTHEFGNRAKQAVQQAREQIASVVQSDRNDVIFTSGATESNNLAILGLAAHGVETGHRHIISSQIEHKAVLEPLEALEKRGFEITLLPPDEGGWIAPESVKSALRDDTLLVSIMQANNETGVIQPVEHIAEFLSEHPAYFHVDAAQGFGKEIAPLVHPRIDLISISGHKIYGPKGIGALIMRRRKFKRPPLQPLSYGGGQERGLRPGTLPVHLIAGFGKAAEIAGQQTQTRRDICLAYKRKILEALKPLHPVLNGDQDRVMPHVINISFPGLDSEAVMVALKAQIAISNGSACTSQNYEPSHVLKAMGLSDDRIQGALRFSWCHRTEEADWDMVVDILKKM